MGMQSNYKETQQHNMDANYLHRMLQRDDKSLCGDAKWFHMSRRITERNKKSKGSP